MQNKLDDKINLHKNKSHLMKKKKKAPDIGMDKKTLPLLCSAGNRGGRHEWLPPLLTAYRREKEYILGKFWVYGLTTLIIYCFPAHWSAFASSVTWQLKFQISNLHVMWAFAPPPLQPIKCSHSKPKLVACGHIRKIWLSSTIGWDMSPPSSWTYTLADYCYK